jgi:hypothetical protein
MTNANIQLIIEEINVVSSNNNVIHDKSLYIINKQNKKTKTNIISNNVNINSSKPSNNTFIKMPSNTSKNISTSVKGNLHSSIGNNKNIIREYILKKNIIKNKTNTIIMSRMNFTRK